MQISNSIVIANATTPGGSSLTPGAISHWPLNTNGVDTGSAKEDFITHSGVAIGPNSGAYMKYNGGGEIGPTTGPSTLAITCWTTSFPATQGIIGSDIADISGNGNYYYDIHMDTGGAVVWRISPTVTVTSSSLLNVGSANRLVLTFSGISDYKMYLNGSLVGSYSVASSTAASLKLLGASSGATNLLSGILADVQLWDYAWLASDVTYANTNINNIITDNVNSVAPLVKFTNYWKLSENQGTINYNSIASSIDLDMVSGPTRYLTLQSDDKWGQFLFLNWAAESISRANFYIPPDPNNITQSINGTAVRDRKNGLNLPGEYWFASALDNALYSFQYGVAVQVWVNLPAGYGGKADNVIISKGELSSGNGMAIYLDASDRIYVQITTSTGTHIATSSPQNFDGNWRFITLTWDLSNLKLYINNSLVATTAASGVIVNTDPIIIGTDATGGSTLFGNTIVNDVLWYSKSLNLSQVTNNYNVTLPNH